MDQKKVLLVDDETAFLVSARRVLEGPDLAIDTTDNFNDAIRMIDTSQYDIVVTDIRLSGVASGEGMDILRHVTAHHPGTKVILLTGYGSPEIMEKAYAMGASNYLEKPLSGSIFKSILQNVRTVVTDKVSSDRRRSGAASPLRQVQEENGYTNTMQKARKALTICVRGLDMLSSSTEDEFILVGENLGDFSARAREMASPAEGVALHVEDIVTLIQFHDITRQQFQRSSRACRAMIDNLTSVDDDKCGSAAQEETAPSALAEDLVRFCLGQARAVEETREKFVSAVSSVVQKLEAIALEVGKKAGNRLAAEIEITFKGICIDRFAGVVADEVLSNLNDICEEAKQFVSSEALERMTTGAGPAVPPDENDPASREKGILSKTENCLGDNVELF